MVKKENILQALSGSKGLAQLIKQVEEISVIDYKGSCSSWCSSLQHYLWDNDKDESCVKRVILLGVNAKEKNLRETQIRLFYPDADIVSYSEKWDTVNPFDILIDSPLVLHFASELGDLGDKFSNYDEETLPIRDLVEKTRNLYAALVLGAKNIPGVITFTHLDSFRYEREDPTLFPLSPTGFCLSREKDLQQYQKGLSHNSALLSCIDEVKHGCETCDIVLNYKKEHLCPMAQHALAQMYRDDNDTTAQNLSHQLEKLSAKQGYIPAHIQIADNLAKGYGCKKDITASLSIYRQYALKGNIDCCNRIKELAESEDSISYLVALPWIIRQANDGDLESAGILADIFSNGEYGVPVDTTYCQKWQKILVESGDEKAMATLMKQHQEKNEWSEALRWCRKLRDMDSDLYDDDVYADIIHNYVQSLDAFPGALFLSGKRFLAGSTVDRDLEMAEACLVKAAEDDYLPAQELLCDEYYGNMDFHRDYKKSVFWGDKALEKGSKSVRFNVAFIYCGEGGVTPDYEKSHRLYKELAKEGNSAAMNNLGYMCEYGYFYTVNPTKAFDWYLKAAEAGSAVAARNVAHCYKNGRGTEQNYSEAFRWYFTAANHGDKYGRDQLISCYKQGIGVEKNEQKAIEWYEKAIADGDKVARVELGQYYRNTLEKFDKAFQLFKTAAIQDNNSLAQYYLAIMHENGEGTDRDMSSAIYWYKKAATNGEDSAQRRLRDLNIDWLEKEE